jgi:hypothetical protein
MPRRAALLVPWTALLVGCSAYAPPRLVVVGTRVASSSPDGIVLEFTFEATNTNEVELPLREARYKVSLDGKEVFSGVRSPEATLRRLGSQQIVIPAAVALSEGRPHPTGIARYRVAGELGYTTPGEIAQVLFDTGVRRPVVSFSHDGQIELGAAP